MKYITIDILENGDFKHKDWVCDAICDTKFTKLIQFIVEEETKEYNSLQRKMI